MPGSVVKIFKRSVEESPAPLVSTFVENNHKSLVAGASLY
jgi:hypothetical protein